jgi:hypothetical protein
VRTEIDLDAAARAGLIDESTTIALRNFQAELDKTPSVTAEKFQLFGGHTDIFTALGASMVLTALHEIVEAFGLQLAALPIMLAIWFAARHVDMRNFPATAAVLMISFLFTSFLIFPQPLHDLEMYLVMDMRLDVSNEVWLFTNIFIINGLSVFFSWLYWRKFRFPPTPAAIIAFIAFYVLEPEFGEQTDLIAGYSDSAIALTIALGTLLAGIWWDVTDIRRETERSQVAFWLHCFAGFLMTQALFSLLTGKQIMTDQLPKIHLELEHFPYVLVMVAIAAFISLLLDRRSLLAATLLPAGDMFGALNGSGPYFQSVEIGSIVGYAGVGIGLISFSLGWLKLRRSVLAIVPDKIAAQLPRTEITNKGQRPTRRHLELWSTKSRKSGKTIG